MEPQPRRTVASGVLHAVIYLRVSTEEQAVRGYSIPEQRRACNSRAQLRASEMGCELRVKEFEDHDSGEILNRPALDSVRDYIRSSPVDMFVCLDPDRFARKLFLQLLVTEEIERTGCRLEFVQHNYETSPEGRLFYQIRGAVSEFEKAKILERTRRGKLGALRQGRIPHSLRVYGYRYVKGLAMLEIEPTEASWVRHMFKWVTEEHLGSLRVAERLNDMGVPAPRGSWWYRSTVYRLLRNATYRGRLVLNRADWSGVRFNRFRAPDEIIRPVPRAESEWHELDVPAIVTYETWSEAQQVLGTVRRRKAGHGRPLHLLTGLCQCGLCGTPVHYVTSWNRVGKVYRWLRCAQRDPRTQALKPDRWGYRCSLPHVRADAVDQWVQKQLESWIYDRATLVEVLESSQKRKGGNSASSTREEIALLSEQMRQLDREENNLLNALQKGLGNRGKVESKLAELGKQMSTLKRRIQDLSEKPHSAGPATQVLATLDRIRKEVQDRYANLTAEECQYFLRVLSLRVIIKGPDPNDWLLGF